MIRSNSMGLMIYGLGQQAAARYKAPDGTLRKGTWAVANGRGGAALPACALGCYDTPCGVAYASAALSSIAVYDLTGTAAPAGYTVYLSQAGQDAGPEELEAGVFASVQSDDTGAWSYGGLAGFDGTLYAWIKVDGAVLDALDAGISCGMTVTVQTEGGAVQHVSFDALQADDPEVDSAWTYISYTFTGTAPEGAEAVYVSEDTGDLTELTEDALTPRLAATVEPDEDGTYTATVKASEYTASRYIVWCVSETGTLTASMTWSGGECLSGDTLISLADGSVKRLDQVRPGDLLLAGDGAPTQAVRVARGRWNGSHTLYTFEDGTVIDEVHAHRFFNVEAGFWQLLGRWRIGDHARRQDGSEAALVSAERVEEPAEMFGLWTESRDYWANGLLSGETAANWPLLENARPEQAVEMAASLEERAVLRLLGAKEMLP